MRYPMKCPECGFETESRDVPIEQGPPPMLCLSCAIGPDPKMTRLHRVYQAVATVFKGGGWASKS